MSLTLICRSLIIGGCLLGYFSLSVLVAIEDIDLIVPQLDSQIGDLLSNHPNIVAAVFLGMGSGIGATVVGYICSIYSRYSIPHDRIVYFCAIATVAIPPLFAVYSFLHLVHTIFFERWGN